MNYFLHVAYEPLNFTKAKDRIFRNLSVPANTTFLQLHEGIQYAMQWDEDHAWDFKIQDCTDWTKKTARNARSVLDIRDDSFDLDFGPPELQAKGLELAEILENEQYKDKIIVYLWDYGENHHHIITVRGRAEASTHMQFLSGKGKPPTRDPPWTVRQLLDDDITRINDDLQTIACGAEEDSKEQDESSEGSGNMEAREAYLDQQQQRQNAAARQSEPATEAPRGKRKRTRNSVRESDADEEAPPRRFKAE